MLRVATIELDIAFADVEANLKAAEEMILRLPEGTDVAVLPELFTTSFVKDNDLMARLAEDNGGNTMARIRKISLEKNMAIAGSFLACDHGRYFNRAFFVAPGGEAVFYDKRHLFSLSAEREVYCGGNELPPVVEFRGWKIAMIVCYDLRFPVWSRNVALAYDMLLVPANWPQAREYAWHHLLIARAIENQAVVVGADRGGTDDYGLYDRLSMIYDPLGRPVGRPLEGMPGVWADVSLDELRKVRRRMPVADSADSFTINL